MFSIFAAFQQTKENVNVETEYSMVNMENLESVKYVLNTVLKCSVISFFEYDNKMYLKESLYLEYEYLN